MSEVQHRSRGALERRAPQTPKTDIRRGCEGLIWTDPPFSVRYFSPARPRISVPVLMVPSPDHPLGLLDLNERASLLRHLLKAGFQVYRLDWGRDSARCDDMALAAYVESAIGGATRAVAEHSGRSRVSWIAYALGGTLALMYAALHREAAARANLICIATPTRFDRRLAQVAPPKSSHRHRAGETFDHLMSLPHPLPRQPRAELRALLERNRGLYREGVTVGDRELSLPKLQIPLMSVTANRDAWVPRDLTQGLGDALGGRDCSELEISGDHFELLAGDTAYHEAWPALERWLSARSA